MIRVADVVSPGILGRRDPPAVAGDQAFELAAVICPELAKLCQTGQCIAHRRWEVVEYKGIIKQRRTWRGNEGVVSAHRAVTDRRGERNPVLAGQNPGPRCIRGGGIAKLRLQIGQVDAGIHDRDEDPGTIESFAVEKGDAQVRSHMGHRSTGWVGHAIDARRTIPGSEKTG